LRRLYPLTHARRIDPAGPPMTRPGQLGRCWVHFSAIAADGFRELMQGQRVSFRAETADQDGLTYRAVKVWTGDVEPPDQRQTDGNSAAYHSTLTLNFDPPHSDTETDR
jgi:cold shock protein